MPRSRVRTTSDKTEFTVSPWQTTRRSGRSNPPPKDDTVAEIPANQNGDQQKNEMDATKAAKLRRGLEHYVESGRQPIAVGNSVARDGILGATVLAFEESGGHFVGVLLDRDKHPPRFYITGTNQTPLFPDCSHDEGAELYRLEIRERRKEDTPRMVHVCKRGGDFARFENAEGKESIPKISSRTVEVQSDIDRHQCIRPYFSEVEDVADVVLCFGFMTIRGWN